MFAWCLCLWFWSEGAFAQVLAVDVGSEATAGDVDGQGLGVADLDDKVCLRFR